jgi:hypothetical protein
MRLTATFRGREVREVTKSGLALGHGFRTCMPSCLTEPVPETGAVPPRPERGGTAFLGQSPVTAQRRR